MRRTLWLFLLSAACSRKPGEPTASRASATPSGSLPHIVSSSATSEIAPDGGPDAGVHKELSLLWNDPPTYTRVNPKTPARAAEYVIAHVGNDPEDAECVVTTFGRHGGTVDANVKRWLDQFRPAQTTPRRMNVEINGMHATFFEVAGTYAGDVMPNREGLSSPASKPAWRLIGAIIEAPTGLWFFKLIGPDLTVRVASRAFEDMVRSARPR
jgi:hypothetical protein